MKMEKEEGRGRDDADMVVDPLPVTETTTTTTTTTSTTPTPIGISGARTLETKAATSGVTPIPGRLMKQQEMVKSRLGKLNQRLKKLNTWSSFLNIMTLMSLTWHLVYLGQRLHITC